MKKRGQCQFCGEKFFFETCSAHRGRFCSEKCYHKYRVGKPHFGTEKRKNYMIQQGYRHIRVPINFPSGRPKGVRSCYYKREHIIIAEKILGRSLNKDERVHHINFDKLDNRPENLMVLTISQHRKLESKLTRVGVQKLSEEGNLTKEYLYKLIDTT